MRAAGDQPGDVRDVGGEHGTHLGRDRREAREVDRPRDRGPAAPDQLRALAQRQLADLVEVDDARVAPHAVADRPEPAAGHGHAPAVRQVPAGVQRHAQHGVAGGEERGVGGEVRGRAGQRLDVRVLDAEQRAGTLHRQRLDVVDDRVALVVAPRRIALGVLVREHRTARGQDGGRDVVLRRDQAQRVVLARRLGGDQLRDARIGGFEDVHGHLPTRVRCPGARRHERAAPRWSLPPERQSRRALRA